MTRSRVHRLTTACSHQVELKYCSVRLSDLSWCRQLVSRASIRRRHVRWVIQRCSTPEVEATGVRRSRYQLADLVVDAVHVYCNLTTTTTTLRRYAANINCEWCKYKIEKTARLNSRDTRYIIDNRHFTIRLLTTDEPIIKISNGFALIWTSLSRKITRPGNRFRLVGNVAYVRPAVRQ